MNNLSALDHISYIGGAFFYHEWRNNKIGAITDVEGNGIYRFIEATRDKNGNLIQVNDNYDKNPIVIVGILGYWLRYRNNKNRLLLMFDNSSDASKNVREQFESYTEDRYTQFKKKNRDNPDTWDWDWDYEFYVKFIIPNEIHLNKQAESIFEYLPDNEINIVCSLMSNYIKYLKQVLMEKGYKDIPELKVLRAIDYQNTDMLEDMENDEFITILDSLEAQGLVKVAWVEGHSPEDIRILDKGMAYMKQLEAKEREKGRNLNDLPDVLNTKLAVSIISKCINKGWIEVRGSEYHWIGMNGCKGKKAQLAYLCGKIYGFEYDGVGSNIGKEFPDKELCKLFKVTYLEKQLIQVHGATKEQKWREIIDELFD